MALFSVVCNLAAALVRDVRGLVASQARYASTPRVRSRRARRLCASRSADEQALLLTEPALNAFICAEVAV